MHGCLWSTLHNFSLLKYVSCPTAKEASVLVFLRVDGMSVLTFPGTGADSADHGHSGLDGLSVLTIPGTGLDSADHGRSGLGGMSVLTFCLFIYGFSRGKWIPIMGVSPNQ